MRLDNHSEELSPGGDWYRTLEGLIRQLEAADPSLLELEERARRSER